MKIKVGFFATMLFLSLLISHSYFALAAFAAVFVHEMGHLLASKLCGIILSEFSIGIFGASLTPLTTDYSYKDEIILCSGGPFINILSALIILPLYFYTRNAVILYFILASMSLAILNLLPIKDFDGGRIVYSALCILTDVNRAEQILSVLSFLFIFILWIISVYFLIIAKSNLSLFIFSISLFFKIFIKEN